MTSLPIQQEDPPIVHTETVSPPHHVVSWNELHKAMVNPESEANEIAPPLPKGPSRNQSAASEERPQQRYTKIRVGAQFAVQESSYSENSQAAKAILKLCELRNQWIIQWPDFDAPTVKPPPRLVKPGQGSNEPLYEPFCAPLPPACDAEILYEHGQFHVYWQPPVPAGHANGPRGPDSPKTPETAGTGTPLGAEFPGLELPAAAASASAGDYSRVSYRGKPLLYARRPVPTVMQFLHDLKVIMEAVQNPVLRTFAYKRVRYLESKFEMHMMFNMAQEMEEAKATHHRDFYNVRKVDTHIHHSACMHQKHLLRFIRKKYKTEAETIVAEKDGKSLKLSDIFAEDLGFNAYEASTDHLNVHALGSCFQRFDLFNNKYNPFGQRFLRDVFLKTDNHINGRFLAEITKEVLDDLEDQKYQFSEMRVSIYGRKKDEWAKLGGWFHEHKVARKQVRWLIQVPRLYHVYKKMGIVENFGDLLRNIFEPLFETVRDPASNKDIFLLLQQLVGFDSVDDESIPSKYTSEGGELPEPDKWTSPHNPPYSYWAYYMYCNIRALNEFLVARGMRALAFRPHCGEAGSVSHLATAYLVADGINHGIVLKKAPVLFYLYYLRQIGLAMSPLSNNALFVEIAKNPFHMYFKIGLNVSLSTDDPLMFHFTDEPLLEEYSIAAHTWKLNPVDLCEIARNSVLQSGFEPQLKRHWLGPNYKCPGRSGNSIHHSNVPNTRLQYRWDTLQEEVRHLLTIFLVSSEGQAERPIDIPTYFSNMHSPQPVNPAAGNKLIRYHENGNAHAGEDGNGPVCWVSTPSHGYGKYAPAFHGLIDGMRSSLTGGGGDDSGDRRTERETSGQGMRQGGHHGESLRERGISSGAVSSAEDRRPNGRLDVQIPKGHHTPSMLSSKPPSLKGEDGGGGILSPPQSVHSVQAGPLGVPPVPFLQAGSLPPSREEQEGVGAEPLTAVPTGIFQQIDREREWTTPEREKEKDMVSRNNSQSESSRLEATGHPRVFTATLPDGRRVPVVQLGDPEDLDGLSMEIEEQLAEGQSGETEDQRLLREEAVTNALLQRAGVEVDMDSMPIFMEQRMDREQRETTAQEPPKRERVEISSWGTS